MPGRRQECVLVIPGTLLEHILRKFPVEHFRVKGNPMFIMSQVLDVKCGGGSARRATRVSLSTAEHLLHIIRENIFSPKINIFARNISHHAESIHRSFSALSQQN